jgi:hypothetical protein
MTHHIPLPPVIITSVRSDDEKVVGVKIRRADEGNVIIAMTTAAAAVVKAVV